MGFMAEKCFFHASAADERNGTVYTFGGSVRHPSQESVHFPSESIGNTEWDLYKIQL